MSKSAFYYTIQVLKKMLAPKLKLNKTKSFVKRRTKKKKVFNYIEKKI